MLRAPGSPSERGGGSAGGASLRCEPQGDPSPVPSRTPRRARNGPRARRPSPPAPPRTRGGGRPAEGLGGGPLKGPAAVPASRPALRDPLPHLPAPRPGGAAAGAARHSPAPTPAPAAAPLRARNPEALRRRGGGAGTWPLPAPACAAQPAWPCPRPRAAELDLAFPFPFDPPYPAPRAPLPSHLPPPADAAGAGPGAVALRGPLAALRGVPGAGRSGWSRAGCGACGKVIPGSCMFHASGLERRTEPWHRGINFVNVYVWLMCGEGGLGSCFRELHLL